MFLNADLKKKPSLADSSVLAEGYLHWGQSLSISKRSYAYP